MRRLINIAAALTLCVLLSGCYAMRPTSGGGARSELPLGGQRRVDAADIALPEGYRIEAVATGLTFPTGVAFDEKGTPYVVEAGYSYGEVWEVPRLLRVEGGKLTTVASGADNGPWTGVIRHKGAFFVAEGGELKGGRILRIGDNGEISTLVDKLPSLGDHHTNGPALGPDGSLYFGIGTATNSAVVGEDNLNFGWLKRYPDFHDRPCRDVTLTGVNYETSDTTGTRKIMTGAFSPYGTTTKADQVVRGALPCNGAIVRIPAEGGAMELVAWGFRNPFGLAFSPEGKLFATDNGYDERGSRPVFGSGDVLWEVQQGAWYGWPDFSAGMRLDEGSQFKQPMGRRPKLLLAQHPGVPPKPVAVLPVHSSADGFDFSRSDRFGHRGEAFIALFGDQSPATGKLLGAVGFKVARVDVKTGMVREFAVNKGKKNGPASALESGGLERPVAVRFDPTGTALYVVDFGILKQNPVASEPLQKTGVLWRITREER